jgi:cytochrome P450
LIKSPEVWKKSRKEIDEFAEAGKYTDDGVAFKETQKMEYLQACIKEALRTHAATGLPLWREIVGEGAEIAGSFSPSGSHIGINTWFAHYNEDVWV